MAASEDTYFAIRIAGDDGVEKLFTAKAVGVYPVTANLGPSDSPAVRATVGAIERMLGAGAVVVVNPEDIGVEGQMIG